MPKLINGGPLAIPLIRTLGNITSGPDEHIDLLLKEDGFLENLLSYVKSDCRYALIAHFELLFVLGLPLSPSNFGSIRKLCEERKSMGSVQYHCILSAASLGNGNTSRVCSRALLVCLAYEL